MRIVASDPVQTRWDEAVRGAGGSVFHSSAWARYAVAADTRAVPLFVRLEDDAGDTQGYALGFRARSRRPVFGALTGRFWLATAPLVGDAETLDGFLRLLEEAARDAGDVVLEVGSYGAADCGFVLEMRGYATTARYEFVLSLERTPDELWKAMDPKRRNDIRRGGRSAVVIEELPPEPGVAILRRVQDASRERILRRGGPAWQSGSDSAADSVRQLLEDGVGRIVGARVGDEWVSASLITSFNGRVYYALAGHTRRGLETQAPSVLLWECIRWHRSCGDREFNLGGCAVEALDKRSAEHGLYRYKAAFGGMRVRCTSGTKVLRPIRRQLAGVLQALRGGRS